jgi:hypothetical protein
MPEHRLSQQTDQAVSAILASVRASARASATVSVIRDQQLRREPERRSTKAPRRRDQRDARLFNLTRRS